MVESLAAFSWYFLVAAGLFVCLFFWTYDEENFYKQFARQPCFTWKHQNKQVNKREKMIKQEELWKKETFIKKSKTVSPQHNKYATHLNLQTTIMSSQSVLWFEFQIDFLLFSSVNKWHTNTTWLFKIHINLQQCMMLLYFFPFIRLFVLIATFVVYPLRLQDE